MASLSTSRSPAADYETVVGLEVHAQLLTRSKMFCRCPADYSGAAPNTHVCPVCLGMPGVLPLINRQAIEFAIMTGLALNCSVAEVSRFDRKNYHYPDLMKGYQISQYDLPLCRDGWIDIGDDGAERRIGVIRVHMEEDTARLVHRSEPGGAYSLVDVNRSGVPLMEIVSAPDLRSPEEARQYLVKLRTVLQYLGVSTGNMEEGSFRCDANVSIRPSGEQQLGAKVEVKNMNSFRAVFRALSYEVERQRPALAAGERIVQETRGWVEDRGITVSQRTKEYAHDYRYFPEPDLPPLMVARSWVEELRVRLPELPEARRARLQRDHGLSGYDAGLITASKAMADFFDACLAASKAADVGRRAKAIANWLLGDVSRLLNATGLELPQTALTAEHLVQLIDLVEAGRLSGTNAKEVLEATFDSGRPPADIVVERGLAQLSDAGALAGVVERVLAANDKAVADYRQGKEAALRFLVGQVMRETRGRAQPDLASELLRRSLADG